MEVTRRKMLMGAAGLCAASTMGGISIGCKELAHKAGSAPRKNQAQAAPAPTPCPPGANPFSIILHGLFLVELWDSKIPNEQRVRVISPKCAGMTIPHEHVAGSWKNLNFSSISQVSAPGWQTTRTTRPSIKGLPTLAGWAGKVLNSKSHHSLYLPWPDLITPLRNVNPATVNYSGLGSVSSFPLALALRYQCAPKDLAPIDGTDWSKDFNFHIFCEPKCAVPCEQLQAHAQDTLRCIAESFGSNPPAFTLMPKTWDCTPQPTDPPPTGSHIDQREEGSLSEIQLCRPASGIVQATSVHLPMCSSLILTP